MRNHGLLMAFMMVMLIGFFYGGIWVGKAQAQTLTDPPVQYMTGEDLPVVYEPSFIERLVISHPDGTPAIILRTIDGKPVIMLLDEGETEEKGVLDFRAGRAQGAKRVLGRD